MLIGELDENSEALCGLESSVEVMNSQRMQGSCSIKRTSKKQSALTSRKASRTLYHCTICKKQATYDERDKHLETRIHKVNAKEVGREGSEEGVFKICSKTQDCQECKLPAFQGKLIRKQTEVYSADFYNKPKSTVPIFLTNQSPQCRFF